MAEVFENIWFEPTAGSPNSFAYLPLRADLQRGPVGMPLISLTTIGDATQLVLSTLWDADAGSIEALRDMLNARPATTAPVKLHYADLDHPRCRLLACDGPASSHPLAVCQPSAFLPCQCLFSVMLDDAAAAQARAALAGTANALAFEYSADLQIPFGADCHIRIDFSWLAAILGEHGWSAGKPIADHAIEAAMQAAAIEITIEHCTGGPEAAVAARVRAVRQLKTILREHLHRKAGLGHETARIDLRTHDIVSEPVRVFTDIGALMAATIH